jgi:hypothetical protein
MATNDQEREMGTETGDEQRSERRRLENDEEIA